MYLWDFLFTITTPIVKFFASVGLPKRKVNGKDYYLIRDDIEIGTLFLTKTNYELANLINPTTIKHVASYVGNIKGGKIRYVAEATRKGIVYTDLVTFLTSKDIVVAVKPKFIRNKSVFNYDYQKAAEKTHGIEYDYLFKKGAKAFYCFEHAAYLFNQVYTEINFKCREIVKGKKIYDENTFLDTEFFEIIYDSRSK